MPLVRDRNALILGAAAGTVIALASAVYVVTLAIGWILLPTPASQIVEPWFTILELLILLISPSMVILAVAIHALARGERRSSSMIAMTFFSICCAITMSVHMTILTVAEHFVRLDVEAARLLFSFEWPSVVYALDVLAWDLFFPIATAAAAVAIPRSAGVSTRILLFSSAALSLVGLLGVPLGDMRVRNAGIVGYAVLFPVAAGMLAWRFQKCLRADAAAVGHRTW